MHVGEKLLLAESASVSLRIVSGRRVVGVVGNVPLGIKGAQRSKYRLLCDWRGGREKGGRAGGADRWEESQNPVKSGLLLT